MNVKGAYLNGILKENVYMQQPNGFDDRTKQVCWLQKTLYGLKQSGHEWNKELDRQLKEKGFCNLLLDPCAYIRWDGMKKTSRSLLCGLMTYCSLQQLFG